MELVSKLGTGRRKAERRLQPLQRIGAARSQRASEQKLLTVFKSNEFQGEKSFSDPEGRVWFPGKGRLTQPTGLTRCSRRLQLKPALPFGHSLNAILCVSPSEQNKPLRFPAQMGTNKATLYPAYISREEFPRSSDCKDRSLTVSFQRSWDFFQTSLKG